MNSFWRYFPGFLEVGAQDLYRIYQGKRFKSFEGMSRTFFKMKFCLNHIGVLHHYKGCHLCSFYDGEGKGGSLYLRGWEFLVRVFLLVYSFDKYPYMIDKIPCFYPEKIHLTAKF